jgi:hypothetical protein
MLQENVASMKVLLFILGAAIPLANFPVRLFVHWVRRRTGIDEPKYARVPPFILGTFERYLAFILVAAQVEGTATILVAWMAAKLAANWQRREEADYGVRANTLIALMAGTLSLGIGVLGGLIARCALNH